MIRVFRRGVGLVAIAMVAGASLVGVSGAPVSAAANDAYVVQVETPRGAPSATLCRLAGIDLTTGEVTPIGPFISESNYACAADLAVAPDGTLYGIAQSEFLIFGDGDTADPPSGSEFVPQDTVEPGVHLVQFNTSTGAVTDLGAIGSEYNTLQPVPENLLGGGIAVAPSGKIYVYVVSADSDCNFSAFCLYEVDPANPANATFVGAGPEETYLFGLAMSCASATYTGVFEDAGSGSVGSQADTNAYIYGATSLATVDLATGSASPAPNDYLDTGINLVRSIDLDAKGTLWGVGLQLPAGIENFARVYTIVPATGIPTIVANSNVSGAPAYLSAMAIPRDCTPPAPPPIVVTPAFTG